MKKRYGQNSHTTLRIRLITGLVIFVSIVLIGQLYFVQMVSGEDYREQARQQYVASSARFDRGAIYFQNRGGQPVKAARLAEGFVLAIAPDRIKKPQIVYNKLAGINGLNIDEKTFLEIANKENDPYEEVAERLSVEQKEKIQALELSGINLYRQKWRQYPSGSTAAHLLGFYGYDSEKKTGRYGLEQSFNDTLAGASDQPSINVFAEVFANMRAAGQSLANQTDGKAGEKKRNKSGGQGDVHTTIEMSVQNELEKNLKETKEKYNADGAGAIVMNPQNGRIYALGSLPRFDPNTYGQSKVEYFDNPLIGSAFEMGSIVKALTMAAGLDTGAVSPSSTYVDKGSTRVSGYTISNYDGVARGRVDMQAVLNKSLNLGAMHVMEQMGHEQFSQYLVDFGLGKKTSIDLPGEVHGASDLEGRQKVGYATASFGQGISTTPISIIRALSALGNGGTLPQPHVVEKIDYQYGPSWEYEAKKQPRVLKKETSEEISRMLVKVMDDAMLGGKVALEDYTIAAKTGTAQIPAPDGGYYEDRYLHTYFGYFPAYDPKFITFLYVEDPKGVRYASHSLTEPFMDTAKFLLNYYDVPPDR